MGFTLYIVVTAVIVTVHGGHGNSQKKYGCLFGTNICTPPEDCWNDGLVGNCQVPQTKKWSSVEDRLLTQKMMLKDLETKGYILDYEALRDYFESQDTFTKNQDYGMRTENIELLAVLQKYNANYENPALIKNDNNDAGVKDDYRPNQDLDHWHQEYRRSSENSALDSRRSRIVALVKQTKKLLASDGHKFSDLNEDQIQLIVEYLSEKLASDEKKQKKYHVAFNEKPEVIDFGKSDDNISKKNFDEIPIDKVSSTEESNFEEQEVSKDNSQNTPQKSENPLNDDPIADNKGTMDDEDAELDAPRPSPAAHNPKRKNKTLYVVIVVVGATVLLIILVTIVSCIVYTYRIKKDRSKKFVGNVANDDNELFGDDYQELCRQHYATKNSEQTEENHNYRVLNDSAALQEPLITRTYPVAVTQPNESEPKRHMSSGHANTTRNSSFSSASWSEEPVTSSLDITTGHAVLSYMEDHLNNKDRLDKEWEDICGYEADNTTTSAAILPQNSRKNRSVAALPYDHNRIKLQQEINHVQSDYINASAIIDNDPKRPLYIAAQGPLPSTIPDFWQMMWEQGCVAVVMLTPLVEEGVNQCARYWPDEGSCTYHNFEIHLVSEHIWCEDYLVRSLYLKHLELGETRTVTQFHFLSWPRDRVPSTPKLLLELRRKVTKCYKGHNSPVLVHCSDGIGRTGTYILLDLAIDRMLKGAKEIDIAATLEHIRDQRIGMVDTKEQFEFALTAVAEEVNAILKSLQH